MFRDAIFIIIGCFAGFAISAGLFALITTIGIVTRIADKTKTAKYVTTYEQAILLGGGIGNIFFIYNLPLILPSVLILFIGIMFGIYVGCLATALSESLKVTAVFSRRLKLHTGIGYMILSLALGKCAGALIYFFLDFYKY